MCGSKDLWGTLGTRREGKRLKPAIPRKLPDAQSHFKSESLDSNTPISSCVTLDKLETSLGNLSFHRKRQKGQYFPHGAIMKVK